MSKSRIVSVLALAAGTVALAASVAPVVQAATPVPVAYAAPPGVGRGTACTSQAPCALDTATDLAAGRLTGSTTNSVVQLASGVYAQCSHCAESAYLPDETIPTGDTLTVRGVGRAEISGGGLGPAVFTSSPTGTLVLNNLSITGGSSYGIVSRGAGTVSVVNSTIAATLSFQGQGVVENDSTGAVNLLNTTLTQNQGPLLYNSSTGSINARFSTLAGNDADAKIHQGRGKVSFYGSILSGVTCDHLVYSGGYNVESDASCIKSYGYTKVNSSTIYPQTAAANGSAGAPTVAIGRNSSAVNVVPKSNCPATDERGFRRPGITGSRFCDAGAYEYRR